MTDKPNQLKPHLPAEPASRLSQAALALLLPVALTSNALAQGGGGLVDGDDFTTWIRSFPGISSFERGLMDDPDDDGTPNLGERIFGTHPGVPHAIDPNGGNLPRIDPESGRYSYGTDPVLPRHPEYSHSLEQSRDLNRWEPVTANSDDHGEFWFEGLRPGAAAQPRSFLRVRYGYHPPASVAVPTFSARGEENLGAFDSTQTAPWTMSDAEVDDWRGHYRNNWVNLRGGYSPKMASNFLIEGYNVPVSITFSAEAHVREEGRRMFVRLLVDGKEMNPADVVLARGGSSEMRAARNFEFTGKFDKGLHTVEVQWLLDEGASGFIRDAALFIRQGDRDDARGALISKTPDSGLNLETNSTDWQDVPGLSQTITTTPGDRLTATFSAEAWASGGDAVQIRVLVDGNVADPGPVDFAHGSFEGTRTMVFGLMEPAPGSHTVEVQWRADQGGTAGLGDRTLTVSAAGTTASSAKEFRATNNSGVITDSWTMVPGLSMTGALPSDSDISAVFSAEFLEKPGGTVEARLTVDGTPVEGSRVMLSNGGTRAGVHAYTFDAKHVFAGLLHQVAQVGIEWKTTSSSVPVGPRSLDLYVKGHAVPDLAEAPKFGMAGGIEPMRGELPVMTIIFDWNRSGHPTPSAAQVEDALFGATESAADYWDEVSGGKVQLTNAGVFGPYPADFAYSHYSGGAGSHQDTWIEAIAKADPSFNFDAYDRNGDGYLNSWNELAVVIVKPQVGTAGFVRQLWKNKIPQATGEGPYVDVITEWYTSNPQGDYQVAVHELGHSIFGLGDHYERQSGTKRNTRPGQYDIMDMGGSALAPHPDPMTKLAFGWVTPRILTQGQPVSLEDVKVSREVVVLPRTPGTAGDEYIVVENRPEAPNNSRYDFGLFDEGIAVWHIVENADHWPLVPPCESAAVWNNQTNNGADGPRAGIRLVRPKPVYGNVNALWTNQEYDLDPFGLQCPDVNGENYHNVLIWADGTPAWTVRNFSAPGQVMTFQVAP